MGVDLGRMWRRTASQGLGNLKLPGTLKWNPTDNKNEFQGAGTSRRPLAAMDALQGAAQRSGLSEWLTALKFGGKVSEGLPQPLAKQQRAY